MWFRRPLLTRSIRDRIVSPQVRVEADRCVIGFTSDQSVNDWGYKASGDVTHTDTFA